MFPVLAFFFGVAFLLITPPFQVPDEGAHFFRAYELAEGQVWQRTIDGQRGTAIPVSMDSMATAFNYLRFQSAQRVMPGQIRDLLDVQVAPEHRKVIKNAASGYGYLSYPPQVLAILAGRLFGLENLPMFYLGRFFALLFYIGCVTYSLAMIPGAKFLLMAIALMPMTLFQAASFSPDCVAFSISFLAISLALARAGSGRPLRWDIETIVMIYAILVMGVLKPVYLPVALVVLLIPQRSFPSVRTAYIGKAAGLLAAAGLTWGWYRANSVFNVSQLEVDVNGNQIDPGGKLLRLLQVPSDLLAVYSETLDYFGDFYVRSTIGLLGFLDTRLPGWLYVVVPLTILSLVLLGRDGKLSLRLWQRAILLVTGAGIILGTILAMYLFTRIKSSHVAEGVQGRYFIPALLPLFLAAQGLFPKIPIRLPKAGPAFIFYGVLFLILWTTARTLYLRYYGPA